MNEYSYLNASPVGEVRTREKYRFEAPRQSIFAQNEGVIELLPNSNFEEALDGLAGFERIWVLFKFHLNQTWKPKVSPPVISPSNRKVGVFASRSPHRPVPIGLSCVELLKIERLTLHIANFDMLDGTPVFDIKPYIPKADAFPLSRAGWVDETQKELFNVKFSALFLEQAELIRELSELDLINFCNVQLSVEPLNFHRKRLKQLSEEQFEISCRTWRIRFKIDIESKKATVEKIFSNYDNNELHQESPDRYLDKEFHRVFVNKYPMK